jgi:hypothetical protein
VACGCGKPKDPEWYVVTTRDGRRVEVLGEQAARIEVTRAGGGTFSKK